MGLLDGEPKSEAPVESARFARGVLLVPYPLSSCDCEGGGTVDVALKDAMARGRADVVSGWWK